MGENIRPGRLQREETEEQLRIHTQRQGQVSGGQAMQAERLNPRVMRRKDPLKHAVFWGTPGLASLLSYPKLEFEKAASEVPFMVRIMCARG